MHGNVCIPSHRYRGRGRTKTTFVDTLKRDTGTASVGELATLMDSDSDSDVFYSTEKFHYKIT